MPAGRKFAQSINDTNPTFLKNITVPLIGDEDEIKPTKRRLIGPVTDDNWDMFRKIRKECGVSWNTLFDVMMDIEKVSFIKNWITEHRAPSELCKKINRDTIKFLEPLWFSNLGKNLANGLRDEKDVPKIKDSLKGNKRNTCIIIGAGPSVERFGHLKMLAESKFDGLIIATDKILIPALKAGVKVDYSLTVDGSEKILPFYDDKIVDKSKVAGIFCTTISPSVIKRFKGEKYFFNAFQDDPDLDYKSLSRVLQYLTTHMILMTGGCCGSTSWIFTLVLELNTVGLIGFDFGFNAEEFDKNPEVIKETPYWQFYIQNHNVDHILKKLHKRVTHPFFKNEALVDFMFRAYADSFDSMTEHLGNRVNTINCTGAGMVMPSKNVECMHFENFLEKYS